MRRALFIIYCACLGLAQQPEDGAKPTGSHSGPTPFQFGKMAEEQFGRMEAFYRELNKLEEKRLAHAQEAIDEAAKLWKASMGYASRMASEWRNLAMAATRHTAEIVSAPWF